MRVSKALKRKLDHSFGIAAHRVAVRSTLPWYWRWLGLAALLGISVVSAAWIYDAGRRFAGFDQSEVQEELSRATRELDAAQKELQRLRAIANAADARLSIERTAQQKLAQQIRTLEQDNARVREELATFEGMLTSEARTGNAPSIYRFKVEPDVLPGEYRYRLLLVTPSSRRERDFSGRLELRGQPTGRRAECYDELPRAGGCRSGRFQAGFQVFPPRRRELPGQPEGKSRKCAGAGL